MMSVDPQLLTALVGTLVLCVLSVVLAHLAVRRWGPVRRIRVPFTALIRNPVETAPQHTPFRLTQLEAAFQWIGLLNILAVVSIFIATPAFLMTAHIKPVMRGDASQPYALVLIGIPMIAVSSYVFASVLAHARLLITHRIRVVRPFLFR